MNVNNVRAIKLKMDSGRTLIYESVYLLRKNDLRFEVPDRRRVTKDLIGDGYRKDNDKREVLNEHVDEFIENLDRRGANYTLLYEKDLESLEL